MSISINPGTWASWDLRVKDKQFDVKMQTLLYQMSQFAVQIQQQLASPAYLASVINQSAALSPGALNLLSVNGGTETTNRTVNALGIDTLVLNFSVTGAINYILTMNNLSVGANMLLRLINSSGAGRTFTVSANNPSSVAYGIALIGTGAPLILSSGVAIANGAAWNGFGTVIGGTFYLVGGVGA